MGAKDYGKMEGMSIFLREKTELVRKKLRL